jgi:hypothetical protein
MGLSVRRSLVRVKEKEHLSLPPDLSRIPAPNMKLHSDEAK